ncbi:MAG: hypothetical protein EBZ50_03135 [Alphaproteobacteria bacterium]|nr:hypothetical protein [Alphaproteobacteria bacterium]
MPSSDRLSSLVLANMARDNVGRLKISRGQNIFDADFEYGKQPLRWDELTVGTASITHLPNNGGVRVSVGQGAGDLAIRQSRPYHRYQPGKTLYMASGTVFGAAVTNNRQRVGFFDDGNGCFFEQGDPTAANPSGMGVVRRSDSGGVPVDVRVDLPSWNGDPTIIAQIDWTRIQMVWVEYAWYGAGVIRFGVMLNGVQVTLHSMPIGNLAGQTRPWARTGNLPVRYELRNLAATSAASSLDHYGVSVLVEGGADDQRGFTYSAGTAAGATRTVSSNTTRFPVTTVRMRPMGVQASGDTAQTTTGGSTTTLVRSGASWTVNQWAGWYCWISAGTGAGQMARIVSNTATTLTLVDAVTGGALGAAIGSGATYTIGYPSQGQLTPRRLIVSSTAICTVELIVNAQTLTSVSYASLASLGSTNSFAERDVSATALTLGTGEVVFAFTAPAGGSGLQDIDVSFLFPLLNNIRGLSPDTLTVAVTTGASASNIAAHLIMQEAMS